MRRLIALGTTAVLLLLVSGCATRPAPEVVHQTIVPPTAVPQAVIAQTEAVAMPEADFWNYIAVLHGSNSDAAYHRLTVALEAEPLQRLVGFDARMTLVLYALDDEARANWYAKNDPSGVDFVSDDDFLYDRADTVSAGRATWQKAVDTETLPWGATDAINGDGESLLYVAGDAAHKKYGLDDDAWWDKTDAAFSLSYETGTNVAGWPDGSAGES